MPRCALLKMASLTWRSLIAGHGCWPAARTRCRTAGDSGVDALGLGLPYVTSCYGAGYPRRLDGGPDIAWLFCCWLAVPADRHYGAVSGLRRGDTSDRPMIMTTNDIQTQFEWVSPNSTMSQITPEIVTI